MPDHPLFPTGLIQVAGVRDLKEARMLLRQGVDLVGLPLRLAVHQPDLDEAEAARVCRSLPGQCCLITYLDQEEAIVDFARYLSVDTIQLHGAIDPAILPRLRQRIPGVRLIKSLVVGQGSEDDLLATLDACAAHAWAFITDTFDPSTGAEGATGLTHDWEVSRRIVGLSPRPVILAGGLNPGNVEAAIRVVRPAGVDVHTGVEDAAGHKDHGLVTDFVKAARHAFREL